MPEPLSGSALCFLFVSFFFFTCSTYPRKRRDICIICDSFSICAVFALSWFVTRIYAFGFIVIRSTLTDPYLRAEEVGGVEIRPHTTILNGLLIFLYILHVYWSYLILRIIVRALKPNGKLDDIREEDAQENPKIPRVENKQEN